MTDLTKEQKPTVGWVVFSIFFYGIVSLATIGTGIYATIESNKINNEIDDEIAFIQKTFHDDDICIAIDQNKQISFIKCSVIDLLNTYTQISVNPNDDEAGLIAGNNENLKMNFQSGIMIPGMSFDKTYDGSFLTNPGTNNPYGIVNTITITNPFIIKQSGSFVFGNIGTLDTPFPISDFSSEFFTSPQVLRTNVLFYVGGFVDVATPSSQRCNTNLGLLGSSMYVVVKTNEVLFCHCIANSVSSRTEYCSVPLIANAITSSLS